MENGNKMTTCKHCGAEIAASAKVCPKCGGKNKKPIYKRVWFIVLIVLLAFIVIGSIGGDQSSSPNSNFATEEMQITYTAYNVSELMNDLDGNALKAAEKYQDQYVELTGRLNVIDSNGQYISIVPTDSQFAIIGVQCYIQNDEQKTAVMDMSIDDVLVVKGKITDVGEVMGYSLDIDTVSKVEN